jgi:eukaryotic-like serine/threonine-protein kinase
MEPDRESETSLIGSVLEGAYRIERLIVKNEAGAIYEAFHLRLDKSVAVKVLATELAASVEALERFRREALVASGLGHPHIVQVFDHSITPTGEPFLAMELLDGEGLDQRLARVGTLSPVSTVHILKQTASALAAVHAKDIVHRNLKPANIWLLAFAGESDFVKVLDFGVSKIRSPHNRLTKAEMLIGTPRYMSPEQASGEVDAIDHRSDQWALACIAWECLAGESPFQADGIPAILKRIVHAEPSPLAPRVPGLPLAMEGVLRRALSKNKDDRFADMPAFSSALENALAGLPPSTVPEKTPAATVPERKAPAPTALMDESPLAVAPGPVAPARKAPAPTALLDESPLAAAPPAAAASPVAETPVESSQPSEPPARRRAPPPTALLPESPIAPVAAAARPNGAGASASADGSHDSASKRRPQPSQRKVGEPNRRPTSAPARRYGPWIAVAAGAVALVLGAVLLLRSGSEPPPTAPSAAAAVPPPSPAKEATPPAPHAPTESAMPALAPAQAQKPAMPRSAAAAASEPAKPILAEPILEPQPRHAASAKPKKAAPRPKPSGASSGGARLIRDLN